MKNKDIFTENDIFYMQKAIDLALKGQFTTMPNPNVGCVIVNHGKIVGEGYHKKAGEFHAEIHALRQAGKKSKGATAYVTLEPCSHFGRTPPCANALIESGITRIFVAMQDPNPNVSGKGIARLRDSGIEVNVGLLEEQAEAINRAFLKRMRTGLPYVQLKLATSLDGKIAMESGESKWITSISARQDVQIFRARASAILSTRSTVQADEASLTVRYHDLPIDVQSEYEKADLRQPIRVIIDSKNKIMGEEMLFKQQGDILLVRKNNTPILSENTQLLIEDSKSDHVDLISLFKNLAEKQINSIWVEAGSHLASALIEQDLVDELVLYYAPKLLGHKAQNLTVLPNLIHLKDAPEFEFKSIKMIGNDLRCILVRKNKAS